MLHITRRRFAASSLALGLVLATAPAQAQEITIEHAQGETVLEGTPSKVFVYDLASLDTLDALGVEIAGVPGGGKPGYLERYTSDEYTKIGSLFEPDYETVAAEEPDLVIVGGRSSAKYSDLAGIAPTIDLSTSRDDFVGSAEENVRVLGRIFGKEAEADALVEELETATAHLRELSADAGTALAIIVTGGRMSAHGAGSRFGVLYDAYGFAPAAEGLDTGTHGQPISFEFLMETNPDWLFVVDRDAAIGREGQSAKQFLDNEIVHGTKAWQQDHIVYVDPSTWYLIGGGIQALKANAEEIAAALEAAD